MNILDIIKSFDIEKQRDFNIEDFNLPDGKLEEVRKQLETYERLKILEKNEKGNYKIKNMCMLSQF